MLQTPTAFRADPKFQAAVYAPLILLTRTVRLADGPLLALLSAVVNPSNKADPAQRLLTLLMILDNRPGWTQGLGPDGASCLIRIKMLGQNLVAAMDRYGFEKGMETVFKLLIET